MRKTARKSWLLAAFVFLMGTPAFSAEPDSVPIEAILRAARDAWHAPGLAAAVVRDDKVIYRGGVGARSLDRDDAVTADTLFPIGSCTKAFTATALAALIDDGKAAWDDPVREHLPGFRLRDPLADRDVRLRDLLCHRIGLARHDLLWYRALWSIEESIRRMAYLERASSFRSTFEYNNLAYLTAGQAISALAKKPWHAFVRERLFKPLKMDHAVFTSGEARKAADHATPHGHDANGNIVAIPWYEDDKQIRASGSIKASARDLSQWLRFQLSDGKLDGVRVISAETLEETHTSQKTVERRTAADRATGAIQVSYGLGWYLREYRGHGILEHGGAVDGFRARIVLVPREHLALVVLTNLEDMEIVNAAGNNLLDHLLGLPKKDWNDFFQRERAKTELARKERQHKFLQSRIRGTKPKRELSAYTGTYHDPAYGTVTIRREEEALILRWSSFTLPLRHFHYETFVPQPRKERLPEAIREATVLFEMDEAAEISAFRFLGRKFSRVKSPNRPEKRMESGE